MSSCCMSSCRMSSYRMSSCRMFSCRMSSHFFFLSHVSHFLLVVCFSLFLQYLLIFLVFLCSLYFLFIAVCLYSRPNRPETVFGAIDFVFLYSCRMSTFRIYSLCLSCRKMVFLWSVYASVSVHHLAQSV